MYAIIDKRCSKEIKSNLLKYVDGIFEFSSQGITYNSISGHPDIFMFQNENKIIIAPNSPKEFINFLTSNKIKYSIGVNEVGVELENSSSYNCLTNDNYFFNKTGIPDKSIISLSKSKQFINLPQAYVRCSMFNISQSQYVTSDLGISKILRNNSFNNFYFNPSEIQIKDHKYGFIGGTMGKYGNKIFFLGDIFKHKDGEKLNNYIKSSNLDVVCLGTDYLYDGGGLFFVE